MTMIFSLRLRTGVYTHILMGPEQLLCPKFRDILRNPEFRAKLGLFAVDEAHCVLLWSAFRAQYAQLVMELYSGIKNLCISYKRESCYKDSPNSERKLKLCVIYPR